MEDMPHDLRTFFVDVHLAAMHIVAQHTASEHHALFHAALLPPLDALGCFAAFLLRDGGHDGEPQLRIGVKGVDVVVHEDHANAVPPQFTGITHAVQRVSCKTGDLLRNNEVDLAPLCRIDHAVECLALFRVGARDALIRKHLHQFPLRLPLDVLAKIPLLALKGIRLILVIRRHAAIGRHPFFIVLHLANCVHSFIFCDHILSPLFWDCM